MAGVHSKCIRHLCSSRCPSVRGYLFDICLIIASKDRYLLNGNVLAARTFITHFVSKLPHPSNSTSVTVGTTEIVLVEDPLVNFSQMAVVTCQRAQGDKNKVMRESWIRLCGTYQSGGGVLAAPEIRKVCYSDSVHE